MVANRNIFTPTERLQTEVKEQAKPYVKPLFYSNVGAKLTSGSGRIDLIYSPVYQNRDKLDAISNKALGKIYEELGQVESLRVAWIERQKALDMATDGFRTLIRIARAVKRRDPKIVRAVLKRNPSAKDIISTPAGLWLGYHFGIKPTLADIHHAMSLFTDAIPPLRVEASSGGRFNYAQRGGPPYREGSEVYGDKVVKLGVSVTAIDPNLNLATRLGLGQPLSVGYELMAFSWLIDYVVNVGEFIKNLEPRFPSLTLANPYTTFFLKGGGEYSYYDPGAGRQVYISRANVYSMYRIPSLPKFALVFNNPLDLKGQQLSYVVGVFLPMLANLAK